MSCGTLLKELLSKHSVNISRLAREAGIKNKTEIYRLFEDKHSYEKAKGLIEQILPVSGLCEWEKAAVFESAEELKVRSKTRRSWHILENLYLDSYLKKGPVLMKVEELLKHHIYGEINIFMGPETDIDIAIFFNDFLRENCGRDITLFHAVNFGKAEDVVAAEIFSLATLMPHEEYHCFEVSKPDINHVLGLIHDSGDFLVFVLTNKGEYAASSVSTEMYSFLLKRYSEWGKSKQLKNVRGRVTDYAEIITDFVVAEKNDTFSFEGAPCFADLSFDVMYAMLRDANYLGLPYNSPYVQELIAAAKNRCYERAAEKEAVKRYILTEEKMTALLTSKRTLDHPEFFRSMTAGELKNMIQQSLFGMDRFEYRFLKPGYSINCIECLLIDGYGIVMWDAALGYGKKHFQTLISHPKAMAVYDGFAKYFWESCTLTAEESEQKARELADRYLG